MGERHQSDLQLDRLRSCLPAERTITHAHAQQAEFGLISPLIESGREVVSVVRGLVTALLGRSHIQEVLSASFRPVLRVLPASSHLEGNKDSLAPKLHSVVKVCDRFEWKQRCKQV